jgi:hypothetical protein
MGGGKEAELWRFGHILRQSVLRRGEIVENDCARNRFLY